MKRAGPFVLLLTGAIVGIVIFRGVSRWHPEAGPLRLSGNIEAHESLVSFKVPGRIVALPVDEGMAVKAGDLLARLDDEDYRQETAVSEATARVRERQLALGLAGSRRQDIEMARQSVVDAQADLEQKRRDLERYESLLEKDEIPVQTRDQAATNLTRARAALGRAQETLNELLEGTRKEEVAIQRANLAQAREDLDLSQVRLRYTVLQAPFDGIVLTREAELGEVVSPGAPVVTLADLDHIWLRVYLPETDLGRVRWGQNAEVRTDTFPGKIYRGHISVISSEAEFTPKSVQTEKERVTLVYRVKIDVENPNHELKPGMPADATLGASGR
jgi:HlyD family secretion protein